MGFRDECEGRMAAPGRIRERLDSSGTKAIRTVEKYNEDAAVQEGRFRSHGRGWR